MWLHSSLWMVILLQIRNDSISGSISGLQFWPIFGFKPNLIFVSWIIQCRDVGSKHPLHIMLTTLQEQPPSPSKQMNFGLVSVFFFFTPKQYLLSNHGYWQLHALLRKCLHIPVWWAVSPQASSQAAAWNLPVDRSFFKGCMLGQSDLFLSSCIKSSPIWFKST